MFMGWRRSTVLTRDSLKHDHNAGHNGAGLCKLNDHPDRLILLHRGDQGVLYEHWYYLSQNSNLNYPQLLSLSA